MSSISFTASWEWYLASQFSTFCWGIEVTELSVAETTEASLGCSQSWMLNITAWDFGVSWQALPAFVFISQSSQEPDGVKNASFFPELNWSLSQEDTICLSAKGWSEMTTPYLWMESWSSKFRATKLMALVSSGIRLSWPTDSKLSLTWHSKLSVSRALLLCSSKEQVDCSLPRALLSSACCCRNTSSLICCTTSTCPNNQVSLFRKASRWRLTLSRIWDFTSEAVVFKLALTWLTWATAFCSMSTWECTSSKRSVRLLQSMIFVYKKQNKGKSLDNLSAAQKSFQGSRTSCKWVSDVPIWNMGFQRILHILFN